jgi:hypothetical protein
MDAKANEFFDIIAAGLPLQHQHSLRNACRCVEHPAHATLLNTYLLFTQGKCSYDKAMHRIMKEVVEISLQKCFSIYNELFAELSTERGKILAKTESGTGNTASALTYGEIDFFSLIDILERAGVEEGSTYVDLGHGTGKGLIAPALVFGDRLRVAYGIEILNSLHVESIRVTDKFKGILREDEQLQISHSRCEILVEEGDILTDSQIFDWTKAGKCSAYLGSHSHSLVFSITNTSVFFIYAAKLICFFI